METNSLSLLFKVSDTFYIFVIGQINSYSPKLDDRTDHFPSRFKFRKIMRLLISLSSGEICEKQRKGDLIVQEHFNELIHLFSISDCE